MYDNLKSLGITNPTEEISHLQPQQTNNDILKIYFERQRRVFSPEREV